MADFLAGLCAVERKRIKPKGESKAPRVSVKAKITALEALVDEKEAETISLDARIDELEQALQRKLEMLEGMPNEGEADDSEEEEDQPVAAPQTDPLLDVEQQEESAELSDTAQYLRARRDDEEFRHDLQKEDERIDRAILQGVEMLQVLGAKSGPFGRKKKPAKKAVFVKLSPQKDTVLWGPNLKKPANKAPLNKVTLRYGRHSQAIATALHPQTWECFSLVVPEKGEQKELDFICPKEDALVVAVVGLTRAGVKCQGEKLTRARLRWARAFLRADADRSKLAVLAATVRNEFESDSEADSEGQQGSGE